MRKVDIFILSVKRERQLEKELDIMRMGRNNLKITM